MCIGLRVLESNLWYNGLIKIVKELIGMNAITGSQAHKLTGSQAHRLTGSQAHRLTGSQAHADYVIGRVFCQPLKQAFSHFCEKVFYVALESEVLV